MKGVHQLGSDLGGIDERKGRTGLGEREGERPSAGLVSVYVAVDE
jgi:hypothetical protein